MSEAPATAALTLVKPIDDVTSVSIRRPTVADHLLAARAGDHAAARDVELVRIVSGLTLEQVHRMDLGDMLRAQDIVSNFLAARPGKPKS